MYSQYLSFHHLAYLTDVHTYVHACDCINSLLLYQYKYEFTVNLKSWINVWAWIRMSDVWCQMPDAWCTYKCNGHAGMYVLLLAVLSSCLARGPHFNEDSLMYTAYHTCHALISMVFNDLMILNECCRLNNAQVFCLIH